MLTKQKKKDEKLDENRYIYACCLKNLKEEGCHSYFHIVDKQA